MADENIMALKIKAGITHLSPVIRALVLSLPVSVRRAQKGCRGNVKKQGCRKRGGAFKGEETVQANFGKSVDRVWIIAPMSMKDIDLTGSDALTSFASNSQNLPRRSTMSSRLHEVSGMRKDRLPAPSSSMSV